MGIFVRWIWIRLGNTNPDEKSQNGAKIEILINSRIFKELRAISAGIKDWKASENACSSNQFESRSAPFQAGTGINGSALGSKPDYSTPEQLHYKVWMKTTYTWQPTGLSRKITQFHNESLSWTLFSMNLAQFEKTNIMKHPSEAQKPVQPKL